LHKLWFVLYKERNLLLTARDKHRRNLNPIPATEEKRYFDVKGSMAAIKFVLHERKTIDREMNPWTQEMKDEKNEETKRNKAASTFLPPKVVRKSRAPIKVTESAAETVSKTAA
jgi:hypothetical protein